MMMEKQIYEAATRPQPSWIGRAEYARALAREIAPKGQIGSVERAIREIWRKRAKRRVLADPVPSVRDWIKARREERYGEILRQYGPVTAAEKVGAGDLTVSVRIMRVPAYPGAHTDAVRGDSNSVAKSYGYQVKDHLVVYSIPAAMEVRLVAGVPTVAPRAAFRAQRAAPQRVWWFRRGRGLSASVVGGFLYRGAHVQAHDATAASRKVAKVRKAEAARLAASRAEAPARTVWITEAKLASVGACQPGIDAARREVERELGADGPVGAVRADVAARIFAGDSARMSFVRRAAR